MAKNERQQSLLPAYLVSGADTLKRETVVKRLRERIAQISDLEFNCDRFDGAKDTGADIVSACNTAPFAGELRLVEVKNADKLRKADSEKLIAYLANPNTTTVLELIAEKMARNTRLYKAVAALGKTACIDCAPMKEGDLKRAVRSMAVGHGFTMTPGAASLLVDRVGTDTVRIDSELEKIGMAHRGSDPVNENEVVLLVSDTSEARPWDLVNAFSDRNVKQCLALLPRLSASSPFALLSLCTTRVRELIVARAVAERGGGSARLAEVLGKKGWQVRDHMRYARLFSSAELERALRASRDAEQAMKSGADQNETFLLWLVQTVTRNRR